MSARIALSSRARLAVAGAAALALAAAGTGTALASHHAPAGHHRAGAAALAASSCQGPEGAAYVAVAGFQAFDAVNTSNCDLVQQYNVGDRLVPGTGTEDSDFDSTDEGVVISNGTLYFADTGNDTVAVIKTGDLQVSNFDNPTETLIPVGQDPDAVTVTPDGSQVWVAEAGPQDGGQPSLGGISVISTATDKVTGTLAIPTTDPRQIAFSPSGATAYVTTSAGLYVIDAATLRVSRVVGGLGNPEGVAVSPDGQSVYVTNTAQNQVDVISAASGRLTRAVKVGQLPWQLAVSADGSAVYVADGDSNAVSVIAAASGKVTDTISVPGDPVSLALTPDGSELWVGGLTSGIVSVVSTASGTVTGSFNVGFGGEPNAGDGEEPTGIAITTQLTAGGS